MPYVAVIPFLIKWKGEYITVQPGEEVLGAHKWNEPNDWIESGHMKFTDRENVKKPSTKKVVEKVIEETEENKSSESPVSIMLKRSIKRED